MSDPTAAELRREANVTAADLREAARPSVFGTIKDLVQGVGDKLQQGFTIGLKDEAAALGAATGTFIGKALTGAKTSDLDFGEVYDEELRKARAPSKRFAERFPVTSTVAEVAGGVVSGVPKIAAGTAVPSLRSLIVTGAGFGAVSGAGFSEGDMVERAVGGGTGALFGGGGTGLLGILGRGLGALGSRALTKTERTALNDVLRAFERDKVPIEEATRRLQEWQRAGGKPEILADLGGDNVRGLLRAAISVPGETRALGERTLRPRQLAQGDRVFEDALAALAPNQNVRSVARHLADLRKAGADAAYELARAEPLRLQGEEHSINDLLALMNRPSMKRAWAIAQRQAKDIGKPLPKIVDADGKITEIPDVETLDWMKRSGLDSLIERFRDKTTGRINGRDPEVRALLTLEKQFTEIIDDLSPAYKTARDAFAGPTPMLNALDHGKRFLADFKKDPFISEETLAKMTASEKSYFRIGLAQSIQNTIESAADGADAVKRIFGSRRSREALRLAMPDDAAMARFEQAIEREANMVRTNRIAGMESGSPTARIAEEIGDMTADIGIQTGDVLSAIAGEPRPILYKLVANLSRQKKQALKSDIADAVGQILMAGSPEEIAHLLVSLEQASKRSIRTGTGAVGVAKGTGVAGGAAAEQRE